MDGQEKNNAFIDRVVQEVLHRMRQVAPLDEEVRGCTVLVTSHVPSKKSALEAVKRSYGEDIRFIDFTGKLALAAEDIRNAAEMGEDAVTQEISGAAGVVLLAPKITLLESIAAGDDGDFVPYLVIRSLLWQRRVGIVLDFEPPQFKRNTFFERLADAVGTLEEMGARIHTYRCANEKDNAKLSVVTEQDVIAAQKEGKTRLACAPGAIITDMAKEKAKGLGIIIN